MHELKFMKIILCVFNMPYIMEVKCATTCFSESEPICVHSNFHSIIIPEISEQSFTSIWNSKIFGSVLDGVQELLGERVHPTSVPLRSVLTLSVSLDVKAQVGCVLPLTTSARNPEPSGAYGRLLLKKLWHKPFGWSSHH